MFVPQNILNAVPLDIAEVVVAVQSCCKSTIQALEVTWVDQGELEWLISHLLLLPMMIMIVADYFCAQYENGTGHGF